MLLGHQPVPRGHLTTITEVARIADGGDECAGGDFTDAENGLHPARRFSLVGVFTDAQVAFADAGIECAQMIERVCEDRSKERRQPFVASELWKHSQQYRG